MEYAKIGKRFIIDYCKEHGETKWLKEVAKPNAEGKRATFFEIKMAFVDKFMPDIKPVAKPKEPTMYEEIDAL